MLFNKCMSTTIKVSDCFFHLSSPFGINILHHHVAIKIGIENHPEGNLFQKYYDQYITFPL